MTSYGVDRRQSVQYKERRVGCNGRGLLQEANPASGVDTVANGQQSRVQHMRLLSHRKGGSGWVGGNMEYHVFFLYMDSK